RLSAGHARTLLGTPDRALQEQLARLAADEGWSVRTIEEAVKHGGRPPEPSVAPDAGSQDAPTADPSAPAPAPTAAPGHDGAGIGPGTRLRPPGLLELEELLAEHLDTRVSVQMGAKRG